MVLVGGLPCLKNLTSSDDAVIKSFQEGGEADFKTVEVTSISVP